MRKRLPVLLIAFALIIASCGKSGTESALTLAAATLTFPAQNSACTTGTVISGTQSTIVFTWNSVTNADSYEIYIKNLIGGNVTMLTANTNQCTATLLRDTPYSWYVVSKSNSSTSTAKSDVWKFYNAGAGTVLHPPFPADALTPTFGQNVTAISGTIKLSWTGADPDNDIAGYDVYFGTTATPALSKANVTDMFLNGVAVTSGITYYWRIVTKDNLGNTSDSGTFQFKVN